MQEVKYLNNNSKVITLDTGEKFEFHWCGRKKRREAGVGILIKVDSQIEISDPDIQDARVMAMIGSGVKNGSWKIEGAQLNLLNLTYSKVSGTIFFGLTEKLGIPQGGSHRIPNYHKIPI